MLARRLMRRRREVLVAAATAAAARHYDPLIGMREVMHQLAGLLVIKGGAHRHLQYQVVAVASSAVRSSAVPSTVRLVLWVEAEVHQRIVPLAGLHHHVAAATAITA